MAKRRMPKEAKYAPDKVTLRKWLRRGGKRRIRRLERRQGKKRATTA